MTGQIAKVIEITEEDEALVLAAEKLAQVDLTHWQRHLLAVMFAADTAFSPS